MRIKDRGVIFDGSAAAANERSCAFTSATRLSDGSILVGFGLEPDGIPPMDGCGSCAAATMAKAGKRSMAD